MTVDHRLFHKTDLHKPALLSVRPRTVCPIKQTYKAATTGLETVPLNDYTNLQKPALSTFRPQTVCPLIQT